MPSVAIPRSRASCSAASISSVATPCRRNGPGHTRLVDQRNAAAPEAGIVRLPHDRDVSDDSVTMRGDKARTCRFGMIGQILARLALTITHPLGEEPDRRLEVIFAYRLDTETGNDHTARLPYA